MLYMIGGPPRVGKSLFASKLVCRQPMPSISLDFLYGLRQVTDLSGFSGATILEKGRAFYPILQELLVEVNLRSENCVLEGEVILPEFMGDLSTLYEIRSVFLGLSSTNMETILQYGGYYNWPKWKIEGGFENEVSDLMERTESRSLIIQEECRKFNQHYFDLSVDYNKVQAEALEIIMGN